MARKCGSMSIGERISDLRKKKHLSQGQLAALLNVSRQAVSKWENDLSSPDTIKLIRLADVLATDIEYLANGRKHEKTAPVSVQSPEVIHRVIEKPVVEIVEKIVEKPIIRYIEKTVVEYVEKPTVRTVTRIRYLRNPIELIIVLLVGFILGILFGSII